MYSAYELINKQGNNIQLWGTPFPIWSKPKLSCWDQHFLCCFTEISFRDVNRGCRGRVKDQHTRTHTVQVGHWSSEQRTPLGRTESNYRATCPSPHEWPPWKVPGTIPRGPAQIQESKPQGRVQALVGFWIISRWSLTHLSQHKECKRKNESLLYFNRCQYTKWLKGQENMLYCDKMYMKQWISQGPSRKQMYLKENW